MTQLEETAKNIRAHLLFMLDVWASLEIQSKLPYPTIEFFEMWIDLYHPENSAFNLAFNSDEKHHIINFGDALVKTYNSYKGDLTFLEKLKKTKEWKHLNKLAKITLEGINKIPQ